MGRGLLSWWRRHIVTRGLAGLALFAVPVGVAALIGFGTSLSGVAGGLSALTSGPDAVPASAPTRPTKLSRAVVALAAKRTSARAISHGAGGSSSPASSGVGGGFGGASGGATGTTVSAGGGSTSGSSPTNSAPRAPSVTLPGSGSGGAAGQTIDNVNGTVNDVIGGVNSTVNGLIGK